MAKEFIYMQTIIQTRIPIKEDGKLGNPEIIKKFTSEMHGSKAKYAAKKKAKPEPKKQVQLGTEFTEEVFEM